ncbi:porin [Aliishimia ponticola]|uniref:Porin n=1 Tax=Aliishimia ponticola TaxID=2499833 RepID=A0A4S4NG05_9RHOB|nr:porin [Aliishimia ponticola]THH38566.1 porin [Aliishimia ponticola]
MTIHRAHIAGAALASALSMTSSANAQALEYQNTSGGSVTVYGQLNFGYLNFDDGESTTDEIVDNDNSPSRVGMALVQPFGDNQLRFRFETALGLRSSSGISQTEVPDGIDWDRTNIRHFDFAWANPNYGTISLGQGSMATDGVTGADDSGTDVISNVSVSDIAGSFAFRDSTGALTGVELSDAFSTFDGGRRGRIRWDSPEVANFTFSVAHGTEILDEDADTDYTDLAVRYGNDFGDFNVNAALGARRIQPSGSDDEDYVIGSVAVHHAPTGLSFAVAAGSEDGGGDYYYAKLGYARDFFAVGTTAFSIDYYEGDDINGAGTSSDSVGFSVVQSLDSANSEIFATYREYSYSDGTATSYQDANATMIGARWKF